jgi:hypothetical protein
MHRLDEASHASVKDRNKLRPGASERQVIAESIAVVGRARRVVVVCLAMVISAGALAPSATGGVSKRCRASGSHVIATSRFALVSRVRSRIEGSAIYGCLFSTGRRYRIAEASNDIAGSRSQDDFRLAGRWVAFGDVITGKGGQRYSVQVFDLHSGQRVRDAPTGATPVAAQSQYGSLGIGPTTDVVLSPRGCVAWIAEDVYAAQRTFEVHLAGGRDYAVQRDAAISPTSLSSSLSPGGSHVTWIRDGQPQSALLRCHGNHKPAWARARLV